MLELQSKIKPFHFATDKSVLPPPAHGVEADEDDDHNSNNVANNDAIGNHLYTPTPDPFAYQQPPATSSSKSRRFRARPCPRKIFSNYFYHKAWEEEQFRALNHRLRSDELLQIAATPPSLRKSMEMRKKRSALGQHHHPVQQQCSRAATAEATTPSTSAAASPHSQHRGRNGRNAKRSNGKQRGGPTNDFVTTCTHPFRFETTRRCAERKSMATAAESLASEAPSSTGHTNNTLQKGRIRCRSSPQYLRSTPAPVYPAARPNLAAQLRAEWARKKICDMSCGVMEMQSTGDKMGVKSSGGSGTGTPSWGVRKMPGWKSLYYE